MTLYAGEGVLVTHTISLEGTALDNGDVDSVVIEIFDSDGDTVVAETAMTYDATDSRWEYVWDTGGSSPVDAGTYRAKVTVNHLDSTENWEIKRIRLASSPV